MRVGGKPAWPLVTSLKRHLRGSSLLSFCDFKCTNYNYKEDTTALRHSDLYRTGGEAKIKIKLYLFEEKGWDCVLFTSYIYNLAWQFRYAWEWISYSQLPCGCNCMVKTHSKFTTIMSVLQYFDFNSTMIISNHYRWNSYWGMWEYTPGTRKMGAIFWTIPEDALLITVKGEQS